MHLKKKNALKETGTALAVVRTAALIRAVQKALAGKLNLIVRKNTVSGTGTLLKLKPKLVIVEDTKLHRFKRLWMIIQIKRLVPEANIFYVTSYHVPELERLVRQLGVTYYGPPDQKRICAFLRHLCGKLQNNLKAISGGPS